MSFDDAAETALNKIFSTSHFGKEALFHPLSGDDVTLNVIVNIDPNYQGLEARVAEPITTINYKRSDIDRRVLSGETFTVAGTIYTVLSMADYPDSWTDYEGVAFVDVV